jgi:hypothetical protein
MARGGKRTTKDVIANVDWLRRQLERSQSNDHLNKIDVNIEMIKHGLPIHFGGMSDPFSNSDTSSVSLDALKCFSYFDNPIILSTKNTKVLQDMKILDVLCTMSKIVVQISFSSPFNSQICCIEPNVPSIADRIEAIRKLSLNGIPVIVRLQPILPEWIPYLANDFIPKVAEAGARHVTIEFMKLSIEGRQSHMDDLERALSYDIFEKFRLLGAKRIGREWILPASYKWKCCQPLVESIHSMGMTFSVPDYGLYHLGDTSCCCGIDTINGFGSWFSGNIPSLVRSQRHTEIVFPKNNLPWYPRHSIRMFINSNSRIEAKKTVRDFILDKWNKPGTPNSPDSLLGVFWDGSYDEDENCVYRKEKYICSI